MSNTQALLPLKLQTAFSLQAEGKLEEAHPYFINGIQVWLLSAPPEVDSYTIALATYQDIVHEPSKMIVLGEIAISMGNTHPDRSHALKGTFPTQLENDVWERHTLFTTTDIDHRESAAFVDAVLQITSPTVRDEAIDMLLIGDTDALKQNGYGERILTAISNPQLRTEAERRLSMHTRDTRPTDSST